MSRKYKEGDYIPSEVLAKRLDELSNAVANGNLEEFSMRVPVELDRDADVVLAEAAKRIRQQTEWLDEAYI